MSECEHDYWFPHEHVSFIGGICRKCLTMTKLDLPLDAGDVVTFNRRGATDTPNRSVQSIDDACDELRFAWQACQSLHLVRTNE